MVKKKEEEKDPKKLENGSKIKDKPTYPELGYAYLAGLIDGDGSFRCIKNYGTPHKRGFNWDLQLTIASTDRNFLTSLKQSYDSYHKSTSSLHTYPRRGRARDLTIWTFSHNALRELLPHLICHLRLKTVRACIVLDTLNYLSEHINDNHNDGQIELLYWELRRLNRRGKFEENV